MGTNIGASRRQRVFAVLEGTSGTLTWPAATDFIRPAGDAVINQSPSFADSMEKQDTLDVLDQFVNAMPPGSWSMPMYVRAGGITTNTAQVPQGDALFQVLQGKKLAALAAAVNTGGITNVVTTIPIKAASFNPATAYVPSTGMVLIGTELIAYTGVTKVAGVVTELTGCTRGYNGTTAASALVDAAIAWKSVSYQQTSASPTFSLWVQTDHFVQALAGCTIDAGSLSVSNEGAVTMTMNGQGMQMYWAGSDALASPASAAAVSLVVGDAKRFSVGMRIYNQTKYEATGNAIHTLAGAGFRIIAINTGTNTLTLHASDPVPAGGWATTDVIRGWLPTATVIGTSVESRYTAVAINATAGKLKATDLQIGTPKQYITDEVGVTYAQDFFENQREITSNLNVYFRKEDARYFYDGYQGNDVPIRFTFGTAAGKIMDVYMPRVKIQVPTVTFSNPSVSLNMPMKALGTNGEDSVEINFR